MNQLLHYLRVPRLVQFDPTRANPLIPFILACVTILALVMALLIPLLLPAYWQDGGLFLIVAAMALAGLLAHRAGHYSFATHMLPSSIYLTTIIAGYVLFGLTHNISFGFLAVCIFATLLLDRHMIIVYIIASIAAWLILDAMLVPGTAVPYPLAADSTFVRIQTFIIGFVIVLFVHIIRTQLNQAMRSALARNQELAEKIIEIERLSLSNEFFNGVIDTLGDALFIADHDQNITIINPAGLELLGYDACDLIGRPLLTIFAPNVADTTSLDTLFRVGILRQGRKDLQTRSGTIVPTLFSASIMRDAQSQVQAIVCVAHDISGPLKIQDNLNRINERFIHATEAGKVGITEWNSSDNLLFSNETFQQLTGYTAQELQAFMDNGSVLPLAVPEDRAVIRDIIVRMNTGESFEYTIENRILRKDGSTMWALSRGKVMSDEKGQHWLGAMIDISDRKQMERVLQESQQRFVNVLDGLGEGLYLVDDDSRILFANNMLAQMTGYSKEELIGGSTKELLITSEGEQQALANYVRRLQGQVDTYEFLMKRKEGEPFYTLVTAAPVYNIEGVIEGSVVTVQDITARKQTEAALQASEARFRSVADGLGEGVILTRLDQTIIYANNMLSKMTGYSQEELIGNHANELLVSPESQATIAEHRAKRPQGVIDSYETQIKKKSGDLLDVQIIGAPLYNNQGEVEGIIGAIQDITSRKQAEAELQASESRFRLVADGLGEGLMLAKLDQTIVYVNSMLSTMTGYSQEELIGGHAGELLAPRQSVQTISEHRAKRLQGIVDTYETQLRKKDGEIFDVQITGAPLYNLRGEVEGVIGALQDITDRKRTERALQRSEQRYRDLFENVTDLIQSVTLTGEYVYVNQAWLDTLGYTRDDIQHLTLKDVIASDQLDHCMAILHQSVSTGQAALLETVFLTHSGERIYVEGSITARTEEDQPAVTRGIFRNITQRKQTQAELTTSERRFRSVFEQAGVGIVIASAEGEIVSYNPAFIELFDYSREALSRMRVPDMIHTADKDLFLTSVARIFEDSDNDTTAPYEIRALRSDGTAMWVLVTLSHFPIAETDQFGLVTIFQDLSEQKRTEIELRIARDRAEEASRSKSAFLASVSHELRTPLNAIIGFAQILEEDHTVSDSVRSSVTIISESGQHLLSLINDVLDVAEIEAGYTSIQNFTIDLHLVLDDLYKSFAPYADEKHLWLKFDLHSDVPRYIEADLQKLRQVLEHLLDNAIKFTQQGGVTVRVRFEQSDDSTQLYFAVDDTGSGIAEDQMEYIFQAFGQIGDAMHQFSGTGLGLTVARHYVRLMGGRLDVHSTPGEGSSFSFAVPVIISSPDQIHDLFEGQQITGLAAGQPVYRILIAVPRRETFMILSEILSRTGIEVRKAEDVDRLKSISVDWHPHAIIVDPRILDLGSSEAAQSQLSRQLADRPLAIAVVSSPVLPDPEEPHHLFDAFLQEPITKDEVLKLLHIHLKVRFETQEIAVVPSIPTAPMHLEAADLADLPEAWRVNLFEYALMADINMVIDHLATIAETQPELHAALVALVKRYEFGKILDALAPTLADNLDI